MVGYFFSIRHPFGKLKENFLFIWANKMISLNSCGGVDFTLVAILDTSGYSNEVQQLRCFDFREQGTNVQFTNVISNSVIFVLIPVDYVKVATYICKCTERRGYTYITYVHYIGKLYIMIWPGTTQELLIFLESKEQT